MVHTLTMAESKWKINNGWNRINACGQIILVEIGPEDFDADYEDHAIYHDAPYKRSGSSYVFALKRDWQSAVELLQSRGYIA